MSEAKMPTTCVQCGFEEMQTIMETLEFMDSHPQVCPGGKK